MYLREMGGVELLSREGEIAIAKRIEAGKDVMINALTQSPIIGKKISEWHGVVGKMMAHLGRVFLSYLKGHRGHIRHFIWHFLYIIPI